MIIVMECMYCYRKFSSKHSLATHKSRYHRSDFKSECEDNEPLIRLMMKAVLDGDIVLTKKEKKRLIPARESIRKVVHREENLGDIFDKNLELATKMIIRLVKQKFPTLIFENQNNTCHSPSSVYSDEQASSDENEKCSNDETDDSGQRSESD